MESASTGREDAGTKEDQAITEVAVSSGVTGSSVQEGESDPGIDNPAFTDDAADEKDEGEEAQPSNREESGGAPERAGDKDTSTAPEHTDPESRNEKADDGHEETKKAPPATMEVTTVQIDTHSKVVSTHKENRMTATSSVTADLDQLLDADSMWATDRSAAVKIRMGEKGIEAEKPVSVPSVLIDTARKASNHIALAHKENNQWRKWTYLEYLQDVRAVAKSFIKLNLEPSHGVGILGFNSPEWFIAHLGAVFAGSIAVGIYTTNSAEAVEHVLSDSNCDLVVVENDAQLQKVLKVRENLPGLKAIIQYAGPLKERYEDCYTWRELMEIGKSVLDDELEARLKLCAPNTCCTIIYTSGSTGNPKGVMLSHDNVTWTSKVVQTHSRFRWMKEVTISYLPLSHIAAQLSDIFVSITTAATVYFAQPDALKGSLGATIKEVRPTQFLAVPRVWEKIAEKMKAVGKQTTGLKKKIATWAKRVGLEGNLAALNGRRKPLMFGLANVLIFKKVKKTLGFDRCLSFYSGAAPISMDTLHYFLALNIPIIEIYGMSESSGPQHIATPWDFKPGTVGPVMTGATTELKEKDADGNGEICFWGRNVFMGYQNSEVKTLETLDDDGYLHSGDVGKWDDKGHFLSITGRIKELLITAGGENVPPVPIEDSVKSELPIVSNAMLIGDKKKFLALLITLKTEINLDTMVPEDRLAPDALEFAQSVGSTSTTVSHVLDNTDVRVMRGIQKGIDAVNAKATSRAQRIQKWTILPVDFSLPGGELTPTMKLRRSVVLKRYAKTIDAFYGGS